MNARTASALFILLIVAFSIALGWYCYHRVLLDLLTHNANRTNAQSIAIVAGASTTAVCITIAIVAYLFARRSK